MPESEKDHQKIMEEWGAWVTALGSGLKAPGSQMQAVKEMAPDGSVSDSGGRPLNGYAILTADSVDEAVAMTKDCPVFQFGTSVTVYQTFQESA